MPTRQSIEAHCSTSQERFLNDTEHLWHAKLFPERPRFLEIVSTVLNSEELECYPQGRKDLTHPIDSSEDI